MTPYTGLLATRCFSPTSVNTTNRQVMSRSGHYARDDITSLQLIFANWAINNASPFDEKGTGSAATITASVEYPLGTMTQVLFSGISNGVIGNIANLTSDSVTIPGGIPNGALFCVRAYFTSTTGVLSLNQDVSGGGTIGVGGLEAGVAGITDKTMSGTVTAADNGYPPLGIIGLTTKPSIIIIGDSITEGFKDSTGDTSGDFGTIARSIGPNYAYCLMAQNGDRLFSFLLANTNRRAMFAYGSHLIVGYGSNDVFGLARTGAQLLADVQTVSGYMTGQSAINGFTRRSYPTTLLPRSTSTDAWITSGANQTTVSGDTRRTAYNTLIRAGQTGINGYFEVANTLESAQDSGLWSASGGVAYTDDGIHPLTNGNIVTRNAGIFLTSVLNFPIPLFRKSMAAEFNGLGTSGPFFQNPLG